MVGTLSISLQCTCSVPVRYTTPCPQCEEDESPTAVQEFLERVKSSDESEGTMIEDDMREIENLEKQLDQAKRLLQTIDDKDEQFPECLKG